MHLESGIELLQTWRYNIEGDTTIFLSKISLFVSSNIPLLSVNDFPMI